MCAMTQPTRTPACRLILPVPRTALPRRLSTVMQTAPPKATLAYESASISIVSRPPIQPKMEGAARIINIEKIAASASDSRRDAGAHAAVGGLQDEHDPRKRQ